MSGNSGTFFVPMSRIQSSVTLKNYFDFEFLKTNILIPIKDRAGSKKALYFYTGGCYFESLLGYMLSSPPFMIILLSHYMMPVYKFCK
jgi:hypothetical protein